MVRTLMRCALTAGVMGLLACQNPLTAPESPEVQSKAKQTVTTAHPDDTCDWVIPWACH